MSGGYEHVAVRDDGGASSSMASPEDEEPQHRHPQHEHEEEEEDQHDPSSPHRAEATADDDDNVEDDASHHHHVAAELPANKSEFLSKIRRQLVYAAILLGCLAVIGQSSHSDKSSSVTFFFVANVAHEPSVRIFRALLEVALLLACTAFSICVWAWSLGSEKLLAELLFQAPDAGNNIGHNSGTVHSGVSSSEDEDDEEEAAEEIAEGDGVMRMEEDSSTAPVVTSPAWILSAALDLLLWILVALVLYSVTAVGNNHNNDWGDALGRIAAPTFPLLLFLVVAVRAVHPWHGNRRRICQVLARTLSAPAVEVTFRDGLIGDVLTSTVRPLQDVAFTVFYILFGLRGWWSQEYYSNNDYDYASLANDTNSSNSNDLPPPPPDNWFWAASSNSTATTHAFVDAADANVPAMEQSWIVHTVVLPACMISPLWWRFLQNMRQTYDNEQRWPYLGNAFKYFCAAAVAMTGVYHPRLVNQGSPVWLACFVLATLYQVSTNRKVCVVLGSPSGLFSKAADDAHTTIVLLIRSLVRCSHRARHRFGGI